MARAGSATSGRRRGGSVTPTRAPGRVQADMSSSSQSQRRPPARRASRTGAPRVRRNGRVVLTAAERRELVRNRLIESRLTPNAISLTGLALNILAAVLVWERLFFVGGLAFVIGSIIDTHDGSYSR